MVNTLLLKHYDSYAFDRRSLNNGFRVRCNLPYCPMRPDFGETILQYSSRYLAKLFDQIGTVKCIPKCLNFSPILFSTHGYLFSLQDLCFKLLIVLLQLLPITINDFRFNYVLMRTLVYKYHTIKTILYLSFCFVMESSIGKIVGIGISLTNLNPW